MGKCGCESADSNQDKSLLAFSKSWFDHGMVILYISIIGFVTCGLSYLINFLTDPFIFYIALFFGIIAASLLIFLVIIIHRSHSLLEITKNYQYPENLETSNLDYDAIIIAHSQGIHDFGLGTGVDNIVNKLTKEKYPYKILHCNTPYCVTSELRKNHAKYIWIFGHGWRGGIVFKEPGKIIHPSYAELIYENLKDEKPSLSKKLFIGQFHCNSLSKKPTINTPLIEILLDNPVENQYFISEGNLNHYSVWIATRKLANNLHRDTSPQSKCD